VREGLGEQIKLPVFDDDTRTWERPEASDEEDD
jgi:hypothetical protein